MSERFYIGKKDMDDIGDNLEAWIADRVPAPPDGLRCEADVCRGQEDAVSDEWDEDGTAMRPVATTFLYRIEDGHVCYTHVCETCGEGADQGYLGDNEYPVTAGGYAVAPRHCA